MAWNGFCKGKTFRQKNDKGLTFGQSFLLSAGSCFFENNALYGGFSVL